MNNNPDREEQIFDAALQIPEAAARAAYLDRACGADAALRERIELLLKSHEETANPLDQPPLASAKTIVVSPALMTLTEMVGLQIGRYKLLEKIGEGGCGVVYVAEQEKPVRRRVALKIVKLGMDTRQVVARFEAERQALALMDHPNIAKVLDGGATENGRPYFVMELVHGIRITEYCDKNNLSTEERLKLFIQVCKAVQHAHQKGIIHRDIKPSNVLVTLHDGVPVPKVIDFGIAKATNDQRLTDKTVYTAFEQFIGTPAYMSPEQAEMSGLDIDTRSDIYSLGVLLYELLTGRTPFDHKTLLREGIDRMRQIIREQEPPRPSTALITLTQADLTTVANHRRVEPPKLVRAIRGDLDWIVMKMLEKERTQRYESATGVAADIQNHLDNEPVVARPPSQLYRFRKMFRRHKFGFAAATVIALVLAMGIGVSLWEAVVARQAESKAVAALDELRDSAPAFADQARSLAAMGRFEEAIEKLDYATKLRPDAADYLVAKGDFFRCQLKLAEAARSYRAALRVQPGLARAADSAKLCEELAAAKPNDRGGTSRESLARLYLAMQQQQRPAAELMPVSRLLGKEKDLLLNYWLARLKDLPVSSENPLAKRLTVRDDGRLALDLGGTKVTDLSPLTGAPLAFLDLSGSPQLSDLSPLRGIDLVELNLGGTGVTDLAPLGEMHTLEKLNISLTQVSDLSALSGLRLKYLYFQGCPVMDLRPIHQMPLEEINLGWTRVSDLSPLIGMPVKSLDLSVAPVMDFSPLARLPLEKCYLQGNRIADLGVLRGKALKELVLWRCVDARNYSVLPEIKTLELIQLPSEYRDLPEEDYAAIGRLRSLPKLRQLGSEIINRLGYSGTESKDIFWQDWDREQSIVIPLRKSGINISLLKLQDGTWDMNLDNSAIRDLTLLSNAPISKLSISHTAVSDLTPLHGMPLKKLWLFDTKVTDLSPLQGMQIDTLNLGGTPVSDISALRGMPLVELSFLTCTQAIDLSPLSGATNLMFITLPAHARNFAFLRNLHGLVRISYGQDPNYGYLPDKTASEFWAELDSTNR